MPDSASLFERLGGSEGISDLVDDIVAEHAVNTTINARFLPILDQPERLELIKQHTREFLEMGSGGPAAYSGRAMREAHTGMNINAQEYMAAIDDIIAVLARHGKDEATQKDVLAIAYSLKGEILHV